MNQEFEDRLDHLFDAVEESSRKLFELEKKKSQDRIWEIVSKLMVPIVVAIGSTLILHEIRISGIEGTRFTGQQAAELERRIKSDLPPEWLREDIREIKEGQRDMSQRLTAVERKVQ